MRPPLRPPQTRRLLCSDGYELFMRTWRPSPRPPRAVLYLHGIQSHGRWYAWSASVLADCGLAVVLPDRRGSGRNARRGDVASHHRWLDDLDTLAAWIRETLGFTALDVVGASWGGKLAVAWLLERRPSIGRLLLVAPGIVPQIGMPPGRRLAIAACLLAGLAGRRFAIPLMDPALFTSNPSAQQRIRGDGLALHDATARMLCASWRLDRIIARAPAGGLNVPTTLVLAGRDAIIDNAATRRRLEQLAAGGLEVREFAGASHSIEFEADVGAYEQFLRDWATANA